MLAIRNTTKIKPRTDFEVIKNAILGKRYDLSLVLCADTMMRRLSTEHKGNTKHTNVLSFPISESEGEIFVNLRQANILHLFIHACLHLKGFSHGAEMEALESNLMKKFSVDN